MLSGYQSYIIEVTGFRLLRLPTFALSDSSFPSVENVEVSSPDERHVVVKVVFKDVGSEDEAACIAGMIATRVADHLAYEYRVAAGDPTRGDAAFRHGDQSGARHMSVSHVLCFSTTGHVTHDARQDDSSHIKSMIEASVPNRDAYYSQLRWILRQSDPVARFMHLYKILLTLQGGPKHTQGRVDAFIISQESGVQIIHNAHKSCDETIYTRLRNEVGHEIPGTTPDSTRQGMEQHLDRLIDHVKVAIANVA